MRFGRGGRRTGSAVAMIAVAALGAAVLYLHPGRAIRAGTGTIAQTLCTAVFVSHLAAAERFIAKPWCPRGHSGHWHWSVDRQRQDSAPTGSAGSTAWRCIRGPVGVFALARRTARAPASGARAV